mgnify:CR=1 FL=1
MTASDLVNVIEGAYNLVQLGQLDNHVGVTTGDDRVSQRIGIGQGLALAILTGVFVGDDGGLYANCSIFLVFMIKSVSGLPKPSWLTITPSRSSRRHSLALQSEERCLSAR